MNYGSSEVLVELEAVLKANTRITSVRAGIPAVPLVQDTEAASAHISFTNTVPEMSRPLLGIDGYDFHGFFLITCNVDCTTSKYLVYEVVDSIQRSILEDSALWNTLVDRNLISVEYDNAEFYPKRSATVILEVLYRLTCS